MITNKKIIINNPYFFQKITYLTKKKQNHCLLKVKNHKNLYIPQTKAAKKKNKVNILKDHMVYQNQILTNPPPNYFIKM